MSPASAVVLSVVVVARRGDPRAPSDPRDPRGTTVLANVMLAGPRSQALYSFSLAMAGGLAVPPAVVERVLMHAVSIVGGGRLTVVIPRRGGRETAAQS